MVGSDFTTGEIAFYLEVTTDAVLKWIKSGKLRAYSTPGGHYRISVDDFRRFLVKYGMPVQEEFFESKLSGILQKVLDHLNSDEAAEICLTYCLKHWSPHEFGVRVGERLAQAV